VDWKDATRLHMATVRRAAKSRAVERWGHKSSVAGWRRSRALRIERAAAVTDAGHSGVVWPSMRLSARQLLQTHLAASTTRPVLRRRRRRRTRVFSKPAFMQGCTSGSEKNPPGLAMLGTAFAVVGCMALAATTRLCLIHKLCSQTSRVTTGPAPLHISALPRCMHKSVEDVQTAVLSRAQGDHSLLSAGAMPLVDRRAMTLSPDWRWDDLVESCSPQQLEQDPANEFSEAVPGDCSCPVVK
jgi:hypothetical protein